MKLAFGKLFDDYRPPTPDTGWLPPESFPNLAAAKTLCIDVESKDIELLSRGPGFVRGAAHIVGLAVGTEDGHRWYFPMRHEYGGGNMDADSVLRWARDELTRPNQLKVGANLLYDLEALAVENVHVTGPFYDVQWAEALLDENAPSYALEALARKYLGEGKDSNALYDWCARAYGGTSGRKQAGNIYRAPAALVGPYAMSDVDLPLRIMRCQQALLEEQGLLTLCNLEMRLMPMLLAMRLRGVKTAVEKASALNDDLARRVKNLQAQHGVEIWAAESIAAFCDKASIEYPRTVKGAPSFTGPWLENHGDLTLRAISAARGYDKARGTFIQGYVLDSHHNGRIHASFHPLRGDDGGTVSGRFSSSRPNLQNIPARDAELGPLIRGLYEPEAGEEWWRFDWSQVEYRLLAHYARGNGSHAVRKRYRDDPEVDFHAMVAEMTGVERKQAKNINFGLCYGMGETKLAASLACSQSEAKRLFAQYHEAAPFVKETYSAVQSKANSSGCVTTLLGRRRRFDLWEPRAWAEGSTALPLEQAQAKHGSVRRAYTHKALNALLQGSAADVAKKAMVDIWEAGICDVLGAPLTVVHDEINFSAPRTPEALEALREVKRIMETGVALRVPLRADVEHGPNWGAPEKTEL